METETLVQFNRAELQSLHDKFREVKHSIANSLAVVMALSELAERNPAHYEKLAKTVLSRGPDIITQLMEFQRQLGEKLHSTADSAR
jgi:hypothetical protein